MDLGDVRYIAGVSWPRSGHHLVVRLLKRYFGHGFEYCEHYIPDDCCKSFPCSRPGIHFSKSHDFDLKNQRIPGQPVLLQYREFLPALVSNFELQVRAGKPDTAEFFRANSLSAADRYVSFLRKWLGETEKERELARGLGLWNDSSPMLVVQYEDLIAHPYGTMLSVVRFFAPDYEVDSTRLKKAIRSVQGVTVAGGEQVTTKWLGVENRRRVEDFRFYDQEFFASLQDKVDKGLTLFDDSSNA